MKNLNNNSIKEMLTKNQMKNVVGGLAAKACYECVSDDYDPISGTGSSYPTSNGNSGSCDGTLHQHPDGFIC